MSKVDVKYCPSVDDIKFIDDTKTLKLNFDNLKKYFYYTKDTENILKNIIIRFSSEISNIDTKIVAMNGMSREIMARYIISNNYDMNYSISLTLYYLEMKDTIYDDNNINDEAIMNHIILSIKKYMEKHTIRKEGALLYDNFIKFIAEKYNILLKMLATYIVNYKITYQNRQLILDKELMIYILYCILPKIDTDKNLLILSISK